MIRNLRNILIFCLFLPVVGSTQMTVISADEPAYTPESLIENVFLGDGVEVISVSYFGTDNAVGAFDNAAPFVNMDRGIVMSTGLAGDADNVNNSDANIGFTSGSSVSDAELEATATVGLLDIAKYEITFIPTDDTLRFQYAFGSEEYPEFVCTDFNDVFGFFIQGPRPASEGGGTYNWDNIALIPDPTDPSGNTFLNFPVTINFVNSGTVSSNGNISNCTLPDGSLNFSQYYNTIASNNQPTYDGITDVFTAQVIVTPCKEYTIKLAIGDGEDDSYDSAVFLAAKSFSTGSLNVSLETISVDGSVAEGCSMGSLRFSLPNNTATDLDVSFTLITSDPLFPNLATEGVDYSLLSLPVIIPAGSNEVMIPIEAYEDGIMEGDEYISFEVRKDECHLDTFRVLIRESIIEPMEMPSDVTICPGKSTFLDVNLPPTFMLPEPPKFSYAGPSVLLGDAGINEYYFDITVSNVAPDILADGVIKRVCIDSMSSLAFDMSIYDFYLFGPDGQVLELATDIGEGLFDGLVPPVDVDTFINMCFVPQVSNNINNGNPTLGSFFPGNPEYSGDFSPEGEFSDLWDGTYRSNGTWRLLVFLDKTPLPLGVINGWNLFKSWSICFNSIYSLSYEWSPNDGSIDCLDCEDITVNPSSTTMYYLETSDSYGCTTIDSVLVTIDPGLPAPDVICKILSGSAIQFSWTLIPMATYLVQVNGMGPWIDIGNVALYDVTGLANNETVTLSVQYSVDGCTSEIGRDTCTTPSCDPPLVVINDINASCEGMIQNGNIQFIVSGTTPPYDFDFPGEPNMAIFVEGGTLDYTGLVGGDYTITVTDDLSCAIEVNFSIDSLPLLDFNQVIVQEISCIHDSDGAATIEVFNGVGEYVFEWLHDSSIDSIATGLSDGIYTLFVDDEGPCPPLFAVVTISDPDTLEVDGFMNTPDGCTGTNTGESIVEVTGGTEPYSYAWSAGTELMDTAINLPSGTIMVTVTDAHNCTTTGTTNIPNSPPIIYNGFVVNLNCQVSGTAEIIVTGGTGQYSYLWDDLSVDNPHISAMVGPISVTVTDEAGCTFEYNTIINPQQFLTASENHSDVSCFRGNDGMIDIGVIGGMGGESYEWSDVSLTGANVTSLDTGMYCVTVSEGIYCPDTVWILITQPDSIIIMEDVTDAGCTAGVKGSIDINVMGGEGGYQYSWVGPGSPPYTSNFKDISDLESGFYNLTVTDDNLCTAVLLNVEIGLSDAINIMQTKTNVTCNGEFTGEIALDVLGGTVPYDYDWTGPKGFVDTIEDITGLEAGVYNITVTDQNGCSGSSSYLISEPEDSLAINISQPDTICFNASDGMASINSMGGTGPYSIMWSTGDTTLIINGLIAGNYSVIVTDDNMCTEMVSIEVTQLDTLLLEVVQGDPSCHDDNDGTAEVTSILYGNQSQPLDDFTISWSSEPTNNTEILDGVVAGNSYFVEVEDKFGCTARFDWTAFNPPEVELIEINSSDVSCYLGSDGMIEVDASGGQGPYKYLWDQNTGFQMGPIVQSLLSGSYVVTVADDNGCTSTDIYNIDEPIELSVDFRVFNIFCAGGNDGELEIIAGGGAEPYSYMWSTGSSDDEISNLSTGVYYATVTDGNGCQVLDSIFVDEPEFGLVMDAVASDVMCEGGRDGIIEASASGGTGIYVFSSDGIIYTGSPTLVGLTAGTYSVYVKDSNGCIDSITGLIVDEPPPVTVGIGDDITVDYNSSMDIFATITNSSGDVTYDWNTFDRGKVTCFDCHPLHIDSIVSDMVVELDIIDENGCRASDSRRITILNHNYIKVPTGFTPNGDNINDLLHVYGPDDSRVLSFRVYSRWGEKIFEAEDFIVNMEDIGWDGTFDGEEMNPGVFVWVAEIEFDYGKRQVFNGHTTLIR